MTQPSMSEYEYWSGKPLDDQHKICLVPQSIADGWEAFCSCGKWKSFKSFYDFPTKESLIDALRADHASHVAQEPRP